MAPFQFDCFYFNCIHHTHTCLTSVDWLFSRLKPIQGIQIPGAQTSRLHQNKYNIWSNSLQEEVMENLKGTIIFVIFIFVLKSEPINNNIDLCGFI